MTKTFAENNLIIEEAKSKRDFQEIEILFPNIKLFNNIKNQSAIKVIVARNRNKSLILGVVVIQITSNIPQRGTHSQSDIKEATVSYICIKKRWRRLGLGTALLRDAENVCKSEGVNKLLLIYDVQNSTVEALIRKRKGWHTNESFTGYTFRSRRRMKPTLQSLERKARNRDTGLIVKSLLHCNQEELIQASYEHETPRWAQLNHQKIENSALEYSRVIYKEKSIIGWLITYPVGEDTLDYRILWTNKIHRSTSSTLAVMTALTEIIRAAHFSLETEPQVSTCDSGFPWKNGFFLVHTDNAAMNNFAIKRLAGSEGHQNRLHLGEKCLDR